MGKHKEAGIEYGYRKLAAAIVFQAVEDYKEAENTVRGRRTKKHIKDFIHSPFYRLLTDIDPDYLICELEESETRSEYLGDPTIEIMERVYKGDGYLTMPELLLILGKSPKTIDRAIHAGKLVLSATPIRGQNRCVTAESVRRYMGVA